MTLTEADLAEDDAAQGAASESNNGEMTLTEADLEGDVATDNSDDKKADSAEAPGAKGRPRGDGGGAYIERPLLLKRHTMELGGEIGITAGVNVPHNDPAAQTAGGGVFFFSPSMGYFVIDNLELIFDLNVRLGFGDEARPDLTSELLMPEDWTVVGFAGGLQYIFDFNVICLYLGGMLGANFAIPQGPGATRPYFMIHLTPGKTANNIGLFRITRDARSQRLLRRCLPKRFYTSFNVLYRREAALRDGGPYRRGC